MQNKTKRKKKMSIDLNGETIQNWNFTNWRKCEQRFKWSLTKFRIGISQSKESVNMDLNEQQNIKLEFYKVKKLWT